MVNDHKDDMMAISPYSIVIRKDGEGFYKEKNIGAFFMMYLGISPQNPKLAIVAITREDVVGFHKDEPIVKLPFSSISFEEIDNLIEASDDVLVKLGIK